MTTLLPAHSGTPALARRFVSEAISGWELGCGEDAALLTSELVTNAVVHARTGVELSVHRLADGVRVEVADADPGLPVTRPADPCSIGGRGLQIVAGLARSWGAAVRDQAADGKSVWFEMDGR